MSKTWIGDGRRAVIKAIKAINWLNSARGRPAAAASFLLNSVPKAGTNLLSKAISLLPGVQPRHVSFLPEDVRRQQPPVDGDPLVMVGVGADAWLSLAAVETFLRSTLLAQAAAPTPYARGHIPFSPELSALLRRLGLRSVLILRDPRDTALSHVTYVMTNPAHRLHAHYQGLPEAERLGATLRGIPAAAPGEPFLLGIGERYRLFLPWLQDANTCITRFEALVGPRGGGSEAAQIAELTAIVRHLGIPCDEATLRRVAGDLFGGTRNFRQGASGAWRQAFDAEHKQLCKAIAGDILIALGYEADDAW
ncbi:MAG: hypothetical protein WAW03_09905 [Anaerolineae bacterium]|uniref:hypothetical protein n=1 Tax=Candidatus Amarolinea dominans TaxID=3140696 RepID=UPI001D25CECE|nr:hypothetical protein [Anaerolineae bacterium]MBK9093887.1 hypothetical protein [Anaerolineae bacterium]MBK9231375.1 hypothetical protein [Anaerolineae bacterium]